MNSLLNLQGYRLSEQQKGLWRTGGGVSLGRVEVEGELEEEELRRAVERVVGEQEVLRTRLVRIPGSKAPLQVVEEQGEIEWKYEDVREESAEEQGRKLKGVWEEERRRSFNPEQGPMVRVRLVRVEEQRWQMLLAMAGGCGDARAVKNVAGMVARRYGRKAKAGENEEEITQYAQYSEWQHSLKESEDGRAGEEYWARRASGSGVKLKLGGERQGVMCGKVERRRLKAGEVERMHVLAEARQSQVRWVVLSGWQVLLWKLSGGEASAEVEVEIWSEGRRYEILKEAVGVYGRYLPLRSRMERQRRFGELLQAVQEQSEEMEEWQEYYGGEESGRGIGFSWVEEGGEWEAEGGVRFGWKQSGMWQGQCRLELRGVEGRDGVELELHDEEGVYDGERMLEQLAEVLKQAGVDVELGEVEALSGAERVWLAEVNRTERVYGGSECVQEMFEEQARRRPEAIAVEMGERRLSYGELERCANRLAQRLWRAGVRRESRVGVAVERSVEMVIGILGVLKAGGAYVPLEEGQGEERLRGIVEEIEPELVLVGRGQEGAWRGRGWEQGGKRLRCVVVNEDEEDLRGEREGKREGKREEKPASGVGGENLAYVLYTSGSTGRPKGVMITHRGVVNYLSWAREAYGLEGGRGSLMHSPLGFDLSVTSLWGPLVSGQRVVLVKEEVGGWGLSRELERGEDWTVMKITPAHVTMLNETLAGKKLSGRVRVAVIGGEALYAESLKRWREEAGETRLINEYGPTETVVGCCVYEVRKESEESGGVKIGGPIANTRVYVLDEGMRAVPVGVAGEIYIGGEGVGRGYWKQAGRTAERYLPDREGKSGGARMYRSGDVGRWSESGELEYLGRNDDQVKIRGYRIELGEIEAALRSHPQVQEAVVAVRQSAAGDKDLVGYVIHKTGVSKQGQWQDALLAHLRGRLPEYMLPARFLVLNQFPLTHNGKVDRAHLPDAESLAFRCEEYVAPVSPAEKILADIWCEVLELQRVGVHDNYFSLGGNSIRSVRVMALAKERGLIFSLEQIFRRQTIHELAGECTLAHSATSESTLPLIEPFAMITAEDRARIPEGVEDAYPLTQLQMGMLYQMGLSPGRPRYHNVCSYELRGQLDVAALEESARHLVRRHEIFRTGFDLTSFSEPIQLVWRTAEMPIPVHDLRHLPQAECKALVDTFIAREWQRLFDISRPPLVRFAVHRVNDDTFWFTLTECHAVIDGWSLTSSVAELFKKHFDLIANPQLPVAPSLKISFRDYVLQERRMLESEENKKFWAQELCDVSPLRLSGNPDRAVEAGPRVHVAPVGISPALAEKLSAVAAVLGVPVKSVILAVHLKMLSVISGQNDVLAGLASHGRPELAEGIDVRGLFLNTTPFRIQFGDETWSELIRKIFEKEVALLPYRNYPLPALQSRYGGGPLLDSEFHYLHFHSVASLLRSGQIECLSNRDISETEFALMGACHVDPATGMLSFEVHFDRDKFSDAEAEMLARCYQTAFRAVADAPNRPHGAVSLLPEEQQRIILKEWNHEGDYYPRHLPLSQFIEDQAAATPDLPALICGPHTLTYRELNARANQLAHYLQEFGVGPDVLVGVFTERSVEMVIALLGTLKAGGAYVPLDPEYPENRLAEMLRDSSPRVLLTSESLLDRLPEHNAPIVCLDRDWPVVAKQSTANPMSQALGQNLAYVIYTSGSTGKPKGVANTHEAIVNRLLWMKDTCALSVNDCVLQKTPFSFDVSVWEFFWPLMTGARLVLARPGGHKDPDYLIELIVAQKVTTLHFVPSMLNIFLEAEGVELCQTVRRVFTSGEALGFETHRRFFQRLHAELHNLYGPTEAAVDVTYWSCERHSQGPIVPIGAPIANTKIYIADHHLQLSPVGVRGELLIGGIGLARGYLNRPGLTAEKFIPDPWSEKPGARLYRTGDLVRYLSEGSIEYLGRMDHQVKIRGFRIELGEIETTLESHPGVARAVVVIDQNAAGDKRLVGYYSGEPQDPDELRRHLLQVLPEYMLPAFLLRLENLPLTPNGKVDRKGLPPVEWQSVQQYVAPRTPLEELLAGIWEQVFGIERIGAEASFFELGGHSLLALRLIARVREKLRLDLPLPVLFEFPVISKLAAWMERRLHEAAIHESRIERAPRDQALPLSYSQQRLWFLERLNPGTAVYNIPFAMRLHGSLDRRALEQAFRDVVIRHEVLRTCFREQNGTPVQVIGGPPAELLGFMDLSGLSKTKNEREAEARARATQEWERSFDLRREIPVRFTLLRLSEEEHIAILVFHHIASDGWSISVLAQELSVLYQANIHGTHAELPELPVQYADFAAWQHQWLQGEVLERQLTYWRKHLYGAPPAIELPTDRRRPSLPTHQGQRIAVGVSKEATSAVRRLARSEGATLFMVLLGVFGALLRQYCDEEDIVVGTPVAGRRRTETEGLIGFFVNMLAMRCDLSGDPTFRQLLKRLREMTLSAFSHQDIPFERLVDELQASRDTSRAPLFQVAFGLQNAIGDRLKLGDLEVAPFQVENRTAKFDVTILMTDAGEELRGEIEYSADLYEEQTIRRMWERYVGLLNAAVSSPERRLFSELSLLSAEERKQVLHQWQLPESGTARGCVDEALKCWAQREPGNASVIGNGQELNQEITYEQLNHNADQLACRLRNAGVVAGECVGGCIEGGAHWTTALCAVLKVGGVFVPLDPAGPGAHVAFILEDANVHWVIVERQFEEHFSQPGIQLLYLETDETVTACATALEMDLDPQRLGCLLYQASQGESHQAVMVRNSALSAGMLAAELSLTATDRVGFVFNFLRETICFEIAASITAGACMVDLPSTSPRAVAEVVRKRKVTVLFTSAVLLKSLADEFPWALKHVRLIVCEAPMSALSVLAGSLPPDVVERVYGTFASCEAGGQKILYPVASLTAQPGVMSMGHLPPGAEYYLLGSNLEPVFQGARGEIYIGGDSLALGYLNLPERTAPSFIPSPFSNSSGKYLYRTGEVACQRPDGGLERLGRRDRRVTLSGVRTQPEQVESVLLRSSNVREAAVVVHEEASLNPRLLAYIVADGEGDTPSSHQLRTFLSNELPQCMVPSEFVIVDAMPHRSDGEIDWRALSSSATGKLRAAKFTMAPRTQTEERLVEVWREILGVEKIGVHDDFFVLGGYSLLILRVVDAVHEVFGMEMPLLTLFETPTIAGLAAAIERNQDSNLSAPEPEFDLEAEVALDPSIVPQTEGRQRNITDAFLTGGTGFLGVSLLAELLKTTDANIYCLVRAENVEAGYRRIEEQMRYFGLWDLAAGTRVIPVSGDLSLPLLGLSRSRFEELAGLVDVIYHNGATVNFLYPFRALKAANVLATEELLRMASFGRAKSVHFVSTVSVFPQYYPEGPKPMITETDPLLGWRDLSNGYAQSKWVAEKIVAIAVARGIPVAVYRPSQIVGNSITGATNLEDFGSSFLRGCIQLGCVPDVDTEVNMVPVDYVSSSIVALSKRQDVLGRTFHLVNPKYTPLREILVCLLSSGLHLQKVPYEEWRSRLAAAPNNALAPYMASFPKRAQESSSSQPEFLCDETLRMVEAAGIRPPEINQRLLQTYLSYVIDRTNGKYAAGRRLKTFSAAN